MKKIELLSPAGDFECLKMAVFGGANAVYFGAKNFNARAKANNFGEDMLDAVAFCHMYGVKAYLTLNTLIENNEIEKLIETVKHALECGIDAFIVQDFGVLNIIKNCFKNVEIHASTQMAVNNYEGALKCKQMGIKRVVLSRETSLEDIKLIKEKTGLEIEYFIQGALCVCFSGNCYMSSCLYGKSGNKGECLQPCRLPYKAFIKNKEIANGYLLSAKDINLSHRLKELIDAGVDSFKIEGRLRRDSYVAGITSVYRKIIDNNFNVTKDDEINIKKCFNRGDFTEGYLNGNANIIDTKIQGHKGVKIGYVSGFEKGNKFNTILINSNTKINKGDVLKFLKNGIESSIITAYDIKQKGNLYLITTTQNVTVKDEAYLILDYEKEKKDKETVKKLPINFNLTAIEGLPIKLEYEFNNIYGEVTGNVCEKAIKQVLTECQAKEQLEKLGTTNFYLNNFKSTIKNAFIGKKELNDLRRQAIEQIESKFKEIKRVEVNYDHLNLIDVACLNLKQKASLEISDSYNSSADYLVIKPQNYKTFNYDKIEHNNAFLYVPSFLSYTDLEIIEKILNYNKKLGVYAENIGALNFDRKTILGAKLNLKNVFAVKELTNNNVVAVVLSPETSIKDVEYINNRIHLPIFKSNFDGFDLMTFVHCPIKTIYGNNCSNCNFSDDIIYMLNNNKFLLKRYTLANCYFNLLKNVDNNNKILYNTFS